MRITERVGDNFEDFDSVGIDFAQESSLNSAAIAKEYFEDLEGY